jgi:hypothetical protein
VHAVLVVAQPSVVSKSLQTLTALRPRGSPVSVAQRL